MELQNATLQLLASKMWIIEVNDGTNRPPQEFYFKGPSCTIGRNVEANHISFHEDKSVSRKHVELAFSQSVNETATSTMPAPATLKLCVKDLASKFGTFMNDERLEPNVAVDVPASGTVIKIGGGSSSIRLVNKTLSLCSTRLDKQEKERLKTLAKIIQAKIVTKAENATHIVSTKITATIKSLVAIALRLKCITLPWLEFCETSNAIELIPPVERYFPPISEELQVNDINQSRKSVLSKLHIAILNEVDSQYSYLMKACGASVVSLYSQISEQIPFLQVQQALVQGAAEKTICLFFDENRGVEPEIEFHAKLNGVSVMWLTAANLAGAVMELKFPILLKDAPTKIRMTGYSQSQNPYGSTLPRVSDSQLFGITSQPPLINASVAAPANVAVAVPISQHSTNVLPALPDVTVKDIPTAPTNAGSSDSKLKRKREQYQEKNEIIVPNSTATASKVRKTEPQSMIANNIDVGDAVSELIPVVNVRKEQNRSMDMLFIDNADDLFERSLVVDRKPGEIATPSLKRDAKEMLNAKTEEVSLKDRILDEEMEEEMSIRRKKIPRVENNTKLAATAVTNTNKKFSSSSSVEPSAPEPSVMKVNMNHISKSQKNHSISTDPEFDDTEWVSVVRGINKMDILAQNPSSSSKISQIESHNAKSNTTMKLEKELKSFATDCVNESTQDLVFEKPITVERNLLSNKRGGNLKSSFLSSSSSSSSSSFLGENSLRNVKRFVKNMVKSSSEVVSVRSMERVLPKESEREIQLRLEFEASKVKEIAMDAMFNERIDGASKKVTARKR